jgi:hypothetical protein
MKKFLAFASVKNPIKMIDAGAEQTTAKKQVSERQRIEQTSAKKQVGERKAKN